MEMRHFYHIYAGGAWSEPVREHADALGEAGFPGAVTVGLVGPPEDRVRAREMTSLRLAEAGVRVPDVWLEADAGYEQLTLSAVRDFAVANPGYVILYAHTKGARDNSEWNACWRRSMTRRVVGGWRLCAGLLADGHDTVGCHWLTPERDNDPPDYPVTTPMYGGNFWWATASYLAKLPAPGTESRFSAEEWVGLGGPRAYDLLPGWPTMKLCAP
jgi:hypothetical protein